MLRRSVKNRIAVNKARKHLGMGAPEVKVLHHVLNKLCIPARQTRQALRDMEVNVTEAPPEEQAQGFTHHVEFVIHLPGFREQHAQ